VLGTRLVGGDGVLIAAIAYTEVIVRPLQFVLNTRADTNAGRAGGGGEDPILASSEADRAFRPSVVATVESRPLVSFRRVHA
jgi:hypothetical protein